ncbi:MAG: NADH-quinone oxidoreductase subunit J [Gemmataceae bacterium]
MDLAWLKNLIVTLVVENGSITLVVVLGAIGVYLLLPRPRPFPFWWGTVCSAAALLAAAVLIVHTHVLSPETVLFYSFSGLAVGAGAVLVTQRNPARAALAFAVVVLSTCGLFLLQAAPFLMAATTIVYAGAIIVTFLFVLMLAQQEGPSDADQRSREPILATVAGFLLLGTLLYVLKLSYGTEDIDALIERTDQIAKLDSADEMIKAVGDEQNFFGAWQTAIAKLQKSPDAKLDQDLVDLGLDDHWLNAKRKRDVDAMRGSLLKVRNIGIQVRSVAGSYQPDGTSPLSEFSGPPSNLPFYQSLDSDGEEGGGENRATVSAIRRDKLLRPELPAENMAYLGRSLFTDYLVPVELGGTLLLIATAGAIVIAGRRQGASR